jgi:hypothetical protein
MRTLRLFSIESNTIIRRHCNVSDKSDKSDVLELWEVDGNRIGYVNFVPSTGQIGLIYVNDNMRNCGYATYLLCNVRMILVKNNIPTMWMVCSRGHYFWSVQPNYIWSNNPHPSVTGSGYYKHI